MEDTMNTIMEHPLYSLQVELEEDMRGMGIARYSERAAKARDEGSATDIPSVRRLMGAAHTKVAEGLAEFMAEAKSGKAGRRHAAVAMLDGLDIDLIAHMTLKAVLDGLSIRERLQKVALSVASLIEDELRFDLFEATAPRLFKVVRDKLVKQTPNGRQRRTALIHAMGKSEAEWKEWQPREKILLGTKLVEIVVATTGLAQLHHVNETPQRTTIYVESTQETMDWLQTEDARQALMTPLYLPTIIPPRPWTSPTSGGYWTGRVRRLPMVKTNNRAYLEELANQDMPQVYAAMNAMQSTAWAINGRVLAVMRELWENQSTLANIPQEDGIVPPAAPSWLTKGMAKEDMTEAQQEAFVDWKRAMRASYEGKAKSRSKRAQFSRMLYVAERFAEHEAIYFPYQMDFRGRVYAVPLFLTPQGNDACRGLLEFANGVPLGDEEGAGWLAIHGANVFGKHDGIALDKADFADRRAWVEAHTRDILAVAADPFECRFWLDAENPWQFLAFCYEWAGFKAEGYDFVSSLPVALDGTCNGLQHFSAMLRDPIGGAAVNLIPSDLPKDIYTEVMKLVVERVEQDAEAGEGELAEIAKGWLGNISRKTVKRPVMTLAYGARLYGFKQQVFEDSIKPWQQEHGTSGAPFPFGEREWKAADYMGALIWDCVGDVVVAAKAAMDWLQGAARAVCAEGLPVRWSTPVGLPVQQAYNLPNTKKLDLTFQTVRLQLSVAQDTKQIDRRKQASSVAPNFVHSLDAAHLMRTVNRCHDDGIRSFALIHDSFATHAGNTWALAQNLREEFVKLHTEQDVLAAFRAEIEAQLPDGMEIDPLPPKGTLDISAVLQSPFFFA